MQRLQTGKDSFRTSMTISHDLKELMHYVSNELDISRSHLMRKALEVELAKRVRTIERLKKLKKEDKRKKKKL